ncbi:MAG TPA: hypothetical protein EYQ22_00640 [Gammaproteobacteria bacterium]|nr:hypothetical protein [Gammaproteobacteria bacterium]
MVMVFPSEEWFQQVREVYNSDRDLHSGGGGACDTTAGFSVGENRYFIEFSGLDCAQVRQCSEEDLEVTDFVLEMPLETWQAMLEDVQKNGKASSNLTLNSIDLELEEGIAFSPVDDQYRQDLFYRYNQNFQDFFDASSRVETTFESQGN